MDTLLVQKDTGTGTFHIRSALQLARYIMMANSQGLHAAYRYYDNDFHTSVSLVTTFDAIRSIFKDYPAIVEDRYFTDTLFKVDSFLASHYLHITSRYGTHPGMAARCRRLKI